MEETMIADTEPMTTEAEAAEAAPAAAHAGQENGPALMYPSIGRTVHYMLTEFDADAITSRRSAVGELHHVGNFVTAGQIYPMVITRLWGDGPMAAVNGQVSLDGTDLYWATSKQQVAADAEDKIGRWFVPARV